MELLNLRQALTHLRIISHDWSCLTKTKHSLLKVKQFLRTKALMKEDERLFDLYDSIILAIKIIEEEMLSSDLDGEYFDGNIFMSVLNDFGLADFTRDDYLKLLKETTNES